jgi:sulfatase modifying factor 1
MNRNRFRTRASLVTVGTLAGALFALGGVGVGCTFPDYAVADDAATTDAMTTTTTTDGGAVDAPVSCATQPDGTAIPCTCSAASDAGVDGGGEVGPSGTGYAVCSGGVAGTCVGCGEALACVGATTPAAIVCVPGGTLPLGAMNTSVCPPAGCANEVAEHTVALTHYQLDQYEVSVGKFRMWWSAGHVTPASGTTIFTAGDGTKVTWNGSWAVKEPLTGDPNSNWSSTAGTLEAAPVNGVDWPTALAYCVSLGARLPTEAEWEAAASNGQGSMFPWSAPATRDQSIDTSTLDCSHAISSVGAGCSGRPKGASTTTAGAARTNGADDLAGSVAEWVLDTGPAASGYGAATTVDPVVFVASDTTRGVRGGSFADTDAKNLRAQARASQPATMQSTSVGFRCARRAP